MKSKKTFLIAAAALVLLIVGASLLYNALSDDVETTQLAANPTPPASEAPTTDAPASETPDGETDGEETPDFQPAPDFTVYDRDGGAVSLSDFVGKPVILNFWASWCGPCKSEMPHFEEAFAEYGEEIHFVMVNLTDGVQETADSANEYIDGEGYTFPIYYDSDLDAAATYGVYSIPVTYFLDADGYVIAQGRSALDRDTLQLGIDYIYPAE